MGPMSDEEHRQGDKIPDAKRAWVKVCLEVLERGGWETEREGEGKREKRGEKRREEWGEGAEGERRGEEKRGVEEWGERG